MINKENIVAVVVTYNISKEKLLKNINTYIDFVDKVVIVDNSDKKINISESSKIHYIYLNGNKGIAKGLNIGIQYAIKYNYLYVLTMDQDSRFINNIIKEYKENEHNNIIIYSPNYIIDRRKYKKYKRNIDYIYWTMASGNLLNIELYKKNGPFKEEFFIDCVDYEYCLRARNNNYKILRCNKALLKHNPGITKKTFFGFKYGYCSTNRIYYQIRNLLYISKVYLNLRAKLIVIYKIFKIMFLFDNKKEYFKMIKLAINDFKINKLGKIEDE